MNFFGKNLDGSQPPTMAESVNLSEQPNNTYSNGNGCWLEVFSPMVLTYTPAVAKEDEDDVTVTLSNDFAYPYIVPSLVRSFTATSGDAVIADGQVVAHWWRNNRP